MKKEKGKIIWLEVTDYAEALRTCGEYFKKEPKEPKKFIYKYKKFKVIEINNE